MQKVTGETRKGVFVWEVGSWREGVGGRYGQDTLYIFISFSMNKQK